MAALNCSCILFLIITILSAYGQQPKYKICAKRGSEHDCTQLIRSLEVACEFNGHGVDCIQNVQHGRTHFGLITPKEALIASNFVKDVVVIGEVRSEAFDDDADTSTVVLVKQDFTGGLKNLRGKKFCHPGFKFDKISELMLKEFEKLVLKENNVDICSSAVKTDTIAEKELKAVYDFFGPSCRPGPWTEADYNSDFYNRYDRLCELCNNPEEKCTLPTNVAPFMYSLECLLKLDGGDVALTTLTTVKEYFNKSENLIKKASYRYLCRDGSVRTLDNPCVWSKQPWNLIIANRKDAADIKTSIRNNWLPDTIILPPNSTSVVSPTPSTIEGTLKALIFTELRSDKIFIVNEKPLQEYIKDFRSIPSVKDSMLCGEEIKWCTISNAEQEKCLWLAQASLDHAIQPVISCVRSQSKIMCLDDIRKGQADVVTSDAHYGYIARKKGLAPIAFPDTDPRHLLHTLLVIKSTDAANIKSFEDLRNKKACIPEYGGIEWLSFINAGRNQNIFSSTTCDYGGLISQFVGDSCMPGAHDQEHEVSVSTDKEKLCRLCLPISTGTAVTCNTDETNQYYGNLGALKCLKEVGDFAVITKEDYSKVMNTSDFRVLCQNGTLASQTGFNVDQNCALSVTIDSEVVTKRTLPNKNNDIKIVLLNFERRFGTDRIRPFEVFNVFNKTLDLLFKDSTPGLVKTDSDIISVKKYAAMFAHTDQCLEDKPNKNDPKGDDDGGANTLQTPMYTVITTLVLVICSKLLS